MHPSRSPPHGGRITFSDSSSPSSSFSSASSSSSVISSADVASVASSLCVTTPTSSTVHSGERTARPARQHTSSLSASDAYAHIHARGSRHGPLHTSGTGNAADSVRRPRAKDGLLERATVSSANTESTHTSGVPPSSSSSALATPPRERYAPGTGVLFYDAPGTVLTFSDLDLAREQVRTKTMTYESTTQLVNSLMKKKLTRSEASAPPGAAVISPLTPSLSPHNGNDEQQQKEQQQRQHEEEEEEKEYTVYRGGCWARASVIAEYAVQFPVPSSEAGRKTGEPRELSEAPAAMVVVARFVWLSRDYPITPSTLTTCREALLGLPSSSSVVSRADAGQQPSAITSSRLIRTTRRPGTTSSVVFSRWSDEGPSSLHDTSTLSFLSSSPIQPSATRMGRGEAAPSAARRALPALPSSVMLTLVRHLRPLPTSPGGAAWDLGDVPSLTVASEAALLYTLRTRFQHGQHLLTHVTQSAMPGGGLWTGVVALVSTEKTNRGASQPVTATVPQRTQHNEEGGSGGGGAVGAGLGAAQAALARSALEYVSDLRARYPPSSSTARAANAERGTESQVAAASASVTVLCTAGGGDVKSDGRQSSRPATSVFLAIVNALLLNHAPETQTKWRAAWSLLSALGLLGPLSAVKEAHLTNPSIVLARVTEYGAPADSRAGPTEPRPSFIPGRVQLSLPPTQTVGWQMATAAQLRQRVPLLGEGGLLQRTLRLTERLRYGVRDSYGEGFNGSEGGVEREGGGVSCEAAGTDLVSEAAQEWRGALDSLGFSMEEQRWLTETLCGLYHLIRIEFDGRESGVTTAGSATTAPQWQQQQQRWSQPEEDEGRAPSSCAPSMVNSGACAFAALLLGCGDVPTEKEAANADKGRSDSDDGRAGSVAGTAPQSSTSAGATHSPFPAPGPSAEADDAPATERDSVLGSQPPISRSSSHAASVQPWAEFPDDVKARAGADFAARLCTITWADGTAHPLQRRVSRRLRDLLAGRLYAHVVSLVLARVNSALETTITPSSSSPSSGTETGESSPCREWLVGLLPPSSPSSSSSSSPEGVLQHLLRTTCEDAVDTVVGPRAIATLRQEAYVEGVTRAVEDDLHRSGLLPDGKAKEQEEEEEEEEPADGFHGSAFASGLATDGGTSSWWCGSLALLAALTEEETEEAASRAAPAQPTELLNGQGTDAIAAARLAMQQSALQQRLLALSPAVTVVPHTTSAPLSPASLRVRLTHATQRSSIMLPAEYDVGGLLLLLNDSQTPPEARLAATLAQQILSTVEAGPLCAHIAPQARPFSRAPLLLRELVREQVRFIQSTVEAFVGSPAGRTATSAERSVTGAFHHIRCIAPERADVTVPWIEEDALRVSLREAGVLELYRLHTRCHSLSFSTDYFVKALLAPALRWYCFTRPPTSAAFGASNSPSANDAAPQALALLPSKAVLYSKAQELLFHAQYHDLCELCSQHVPLFMNLLVGASRVFTVATDAAAMRGMRDSLILSSACLLQRVGRGCEGRRALCKERAEHRRAQRRRAWEEKVARQLPVRQAAEREREALLQRTGEGRAEHVAALSRRVLKSSVRLTHGWSSAIDLLESELQRAICEIDAWETRRREAEAEAKDTARLQLRLREDALQELTAADTARKAQEEARKLQQAKEAAFAVRERETRAKENAVREDVRRVEAMKRAAELEAMEVAKTRLLRSEERSAAHLVQSHLQRQEARIQRSARQSQRRLRAREALLRDNLGVLASGPPDGGGEAVLGDTSLQRSPRRGYAERAAGGVASDVDGLVHTTERPVRPHHGSRQGPLEERTRVRFAPPPHAQPQAQGGESVEWSIQRDLLSLWEASRLSSA